MGSPYRTAAESEPTCALEPPRPYIVEREGTFVNYGHLKELQTKYEALLVGRDEWKARAEKSDASTRRSREHTAAQ